MRKNVRRRPFTAAIPLALAVAAPATFAGEGPYIGLEGGANFMHSNDQKSNGQTQFHTYYNDGWLGGLTAGYGFANGLRPEFELAYRRNDYDEVTAPGFISNQVGGRRDAVTAMANLWYEVRANDGLFSILHPYLGGGVGAARLDQHHLSAEGDELVNDFHTRFAYQGGAGVGLDLTPHLTLSVDYRYLASGKTSYATAPAVVAAGGPESVETAYRSQTAMLGLRYSFGEEPKPLPVAAPYVPPPPPPPAPPPPPPRDSDGDGVTDDLDKCPNTPPGFKVDATGCIIQQTVILRTVNFEFNSDRLTAPAQDSLGQVAAALAGQPDLNVEIDGHTDSVGSPAYNLKLSKKRAESVKAYLISKGVNGSKLYAQGFGKTKPIASNDTEEGRAENRRVEFQVLNQPPTVKVITKDSTAASKAAATDGAPTKHRARKKPAHSTSTP